MTGVGSRGGDIRSPQEAREAQEASREKARWTLLIREHLRTTLLVTGYLHADDIAPLGVPEPHCNLIGSQIASYVNRKLMVKVGERKCEHKAANGRKAAIYQITKLGRETLAGVSLGTPNEQSSDGPSPSVQGCAKADSGESPSAVRRGAQTAAEGTARAGAGVPRQGVAEGPDRAQVRASVHSGEARGIPPKEEAKQCLGCGETKLLDEFYRNKREPDGRATRCKVCRRVQNHAWEKANPERKAAARRKYWRSEKGAGAEDRVRKRWPEKTRARQALKDAVRRGKIVKPDTCEGCEAKVDDPADLHGHHHDYSKPLEVEWLCRGCHALKHSDGDPPATRGSIGPARLFEDPEGDKPPSAYDPYERGQTA